MSIERYLDISTAYITQDDSRILEVPFGVPITTLADGYGFWVHVCPPDEEEPTVNYLIEAGFSLHFVFLYRYAISLPVNWIRLDADGPQDLDDNFPTFNW